ncbi:hypothetical protein B0H14DRAFT_3881837 [Mycena olivaceomarginata]|nr:hypothetical protein B0H14DRAFT_3881837 [Mycena olivaceomarginata]
MAETIGAMVNIIQLVDTALKARDYIQDFHHAPQEQQKLLSEMSDLRPLLGELQTRITANPSSAILQHMRSPLATFRSTMMEFSEKLQPKDGTLSKFSQRLKWSMWSKREASEYLDKFEQFKSLLNSWLLLQTWDMGEHNNHAVLSSMEKASIVQKEILDTVNNASSGYRGRIDSRTRIIEWFSPINFFLQQADVLSTLQAGTGEWLLAEPHFKGWVSGTGETLWCYGIRMCPLL